MTNEAGRPKFAREFFLYPPLARVGTPARLYQQDPGKPGGCESRSARIEGKLIETVLLVELPRTTLGLMTTENDAKAVLEFWFGELDEDGLPRPALRQRWFKADPAFDREIERRWADLIHAALAGELAHWADSDPELVSLTLLFDQFTRNVFRNTPAAFSGDDLALGHVTSAVAGGRDRKLPAIHRVFLYTPFEHAEDLAAQQQGVACFDRLLEDCHGPAREVIADFARYMRAHRDVIARFGRFPHRNAILGRQSTAEEIDYLKIHKGF
jgi:uncharacterized protein (DUF924 family)